jgi:hypothetical protein
VCGAIVTLMECAYGNQERHAGPTSGFERKLGFSTLFSTVDSTLTSLQALGAAVGAWLDLAIRFWLAKAFLTEAVVSMAMYAPMTMSLASAIAPTVDRVVASPLGAVIAILCPTLFADCGAAASVRSLRAAGFEWAVVTAPVLGGSARLDHRPGPGRDFDRCVARPRPTNPPASVRGNNKRQASVIQYAVEQSLARPLPATSLNEAAGVKFQSRVAAQGRVPPQ